MRIALTYNAKPGARGEIRCKQSQVLADEDEEFPLEPPGVEDPDLYAEWDDAETLLAIADALATRHEVVLVEATISFALHIRQARPDLVFNVAEGLFGAGREALVPAILESQRIPYTGSDPLTLALCLDKGRCKEILAHHGVPTPAFALVETPADLAQASGLLFPLMVKPLCEGSSKGIRDDQLVRDIQALEARVERIWRDYSQPALVERFLPGREFTVGVVGNLPDLTILPPVEICLDTLPEGANPIYSYEAKWVWDRPERPLRIFECPARLEAGLLAEVERVCRATVRALRLRDWSRIDLRLDEDGAPCVLEVNPLPGVLPDPAANSCFPKAARASGLDYTAMILTVVDRACQRLGLPS